MRSGVCRASIVHSFELLVVGEIEVYGLHLHLEVAGGVRGVGVDGKAGEDMLELEANGVAVGAVGLRGGEKAGGHEEVVGFGA